MNTKLMSNELLTKFTELSCKPKKKTTKKVKDEDNFSKPMLVEKHKY